MEKDFPQLPENIDITISIDPNSRIRFSQEVKDLFRDVQEWNLRDLIRLRDMKLKLEGNSSSLDLPEASEETSE